MADHLQSEIFPAYRIALLHGRMKSDAKERVMQAFAAGQIHILVSTTVVEVGVDVPNASVMVVEHAERFGLSQLHQLRGRVGRGPWESHCILLYQSPWTDEHARAARARDDQRRFCDRRERPRVAWTGRLLRHAPVGSAQAAHRRPGPRSRHHGAGAPGGEANRHRGRSHRRSARVRSGAGSSNSVWSSRLGRRTQHQRARDCGNVQGSPS